MKEIKIRSKQSNYKMTKMENIKKISFRVRIYQFFKVKLRTQIEEKVN